ncbi:major facilitator superfamily domain-containing protein [Mycena capillaripes]|nr:major facilitator superfamily domain-containing protein [Mycena capillaripes]KAJ6533113.1 major facilitator superfamily domain-containing protein [Mycena capillaripes]
MDPSTPPPPQPRSTWRSVAIAGTCTAAMLVNSSNNTSVAIALPTIGAALHAPAAALQWIVSAYPLSSGCLLLFCGHIADVHGRKRVFVGGSAILAAFTLGCGFARDSVTLSILRGLQGIGGAATIPAALGILAHEFPPSSGRARAAAFSSFSAGAPVGGALGMVLGGLLTQLSRYTWRAQFFLSAAIAFVTLIIGVLVIPPDAPLFYSRSSPSPSTLSPPLPAPSASTPEEKSSTSVAHTYPPEAKDASSQAPHPLPPRDTRTDWPGAFLSAAGLILLVFVLGQGSGPGVPPPRMGMDYPQMLGGRSVIPRALPPPPPGSELNFNLDADGEEEIDVAHSRPWGRMHHLHPPPPPTVGLWGWLFGRRALPSPHLHPHPHGPPRRRSAPEGGSEPAFWRVQQDSDAFDVEVKLGFDADWEEDVDWYTHGSHPDHHHEHHHGPHHDGPHMHSHDGKHPHHHEHGPHPPHHPHHGHGHGPRPPSQGLGAIIGWLAGRPPPPPHWHGPRQSFPPPPPSNGSGGGPPWGGMIPHNPMMRGDEAWGMAYIISLLLLSLLLLALFAIWEFHLEHVHSRPGGYATDDIGDTDPRRSSASSASRPESTPRGASKPAVASGILARVGNTRFGRALKNNRLAKSVAGYTPPPLLPPSLFARRRGRLGVVYGIALLQFGAFMVWAFWVQLYYQIYIGYSPVRTVVRLTPMFVTGIICNVVVAFIVGRVPTLWLLGSGTLTTTVAPLLFALIVPSAPYWAFGFPAAVCSVVGADFLFAAGTMFVSDSVGPYEQSVAGGVFQTMTQLGTSFGVTASTIVFNHVQQSANNRGATRLLVHAAMWMATLLALIAFRGKGTDAQA